MFGKNPLMKRDDGDGKTLQIVSIFGTIQGEGPYAGVPAIFIRLHGCHLRCWFCDTEFSNPDDPVLSLDEIVERVKLLRNTGVYNLVVLTGGEPLRQNLFHLVECIRKLGMTTQIETSGSFYQRFNSEVTFVVSPKTPGVAAEFVIHPDTVYKYVVSTDNISDLDGLPKFSTQEKDKPLALYRPPKYITPNRIYLSPMDEYDEHKNKANRAMVAQLAQQFGYRAGLQLHKFMGVD